ncbi:MAG: bifunctional DNA-formamidopyrimidine glycosylase/DNA-(apurinic or apyrimidinic site) lyase [Gemmatimonadales bacterium]
MPELPEVETIVRDLTPLLVGHTLKNPKLLRSDVLRKVTPRRLLAGLRGRVVRSLDRRSKHAVFLLETGLRMVIQPRMTGTLTVHDRPLSRNELTYAVLTTEIDNGTILVYRDVRRLGTIWLLDESEWRTYTDRIGPEPLDDRFDLGRFRQQLAGTRQAIKKVLMDQKRIAGIGNIYANEVLFRAGIDPSRRTDRLRRDETNKLLKEIKHVLRQAIAARGTTFRDYRTGKGEVGTFQNVLMVYGRGGMPCLNCGTTLATTHAIDGRATTFCRQCQYSDA